MSFSRVERVLADEAAATASDLALAIVRFLDQPTSIERFWALADALDRHPAYRNEARAIADGQA